MTRPELFGVVRTTVVLASGAGPLAGEAIKKICASIDEFVDGLQMQALTKDTIPRDSVLRLIAGLKEDLSNLMSPKGE